MDIQLKLLVLIFAGIASDDRSRVLTFALRQKLPTGASFYLLTAAVCVARSFLAL
jgi:hypothetical protein